MLEHHARHGSSESWERAGGNTTSTLVDEVNVLGTIIVFLRSGPCLPYEAHTSPGLTACTKSRKPAQAMRAGLRRSRARRPDWDAPTARQQPSLSHCSAPCSERLGRNDGHQTYSRYTGSAHHVHDPSVPPPSATRREDTLSREPQYRRHRSVGGAGASFASIRTVPVHERGLIRTSRRGTTARRPPSRPRRSRRSAWPRSTPSRA